MINLDRLFANRAFIPRKISYNADKLEKVDFVIIYVDTNKKKVKSRKVQAKTKMEAMRKFNTLMKANLVRTNDKKIVPSMINAFEIPREQRYADSYKDRLSRTISIRRR